MKLTPGDSASCSTQDRGDVRFALFVKNGSAAPVVLGLEKEGMTATLNTGQPMAPASRFGLNVCGSYPRTLTVEPGEEEYIGRFFFGGDITDLKVNKVYITVSMGRFTNASWYIEIMH